MDPLDRLSDHAQRQRDLAADASDAAHTPRRVSRRKRLIIAALTIAIVGIVAAGALIHRVDMDVNIAWVIALGIVAGATYAIFGKLPATLSARINAENDPRNLSPRLFLPILILVIVFAAVLIWWSVRTR